MSIFQKHKKGICSQRVNANNSKMKRIRNVLIRNARIIVNISMMVGSSKMKQEDKNLHPARALIGNQPRSMFGGESL